MPVQDAGRNRAGHGGRAAGVRGRWGLLAAAAALLPAGVTAARAQALPELLEGRWTAGGDCQAGFTLQLAGDVLRVTDAAGQVDTQRVVSRRATGIATRTVRSTHGQAVGKAWVYEVLGPGQVSLTEGGTGRSADLVRCADPLPASATPRQVLEAIYARYAKDDEPNLPMSSEANLHAFFVPDLADAVVAFVSRAGRVADDCRPTDPFVPGSGGDFKVSRVQVDVPSVADGMDHATAKVAFQNFDKPVSVMVSMDRTSAGWRITDLGSASMRSFRTVMAACAAPVK